MIQLLSMMMKRKKILITGDDGFNSIGIRLVADALKERYEVYIVGTLTQQSAVGGRLSLDQKLKWGKEEVDGIKAIWVDGSPCDAMEFSRAYFPKNNFDLIVSGMNMGSNVSSAIISSGTFAAAFRGLSLQLAPKAIVVSQKVKKHKDFIRNHDHKKDSLDQYLNYPGKWLKKVLQLSLDEDLWGVNLVNINLPADMPKGIRFTEIEPYLANYYIDPAKIKEDEMIYNSSTGKNDTSTKFDTGALLNGFVTISPCNTTFLDYMALQKMKKY